MKKKINGVLLVLLPILTAFTFSSQWRIIAEKAEVGFMIRNAGFKVFGNFSDLRGAIVFDEHDLGKCRISASVGVLTLDTGIGMRDRDLVSEDYFDASTYPRISFTSNSFSRTGKGLQVTGRFTIKDVTRTLTIPFSFSDQVFSGTFTINRLDYGVGESSWIMGDEVAITFAIPVEKEG